MKPADKAAIAELMADKRATITVDRASLELILDAGARVERKACADLVKHEALSDFNDPFSRQGETLRRIVAKIEDRNS